MKPKINRLAAILLTTLIFAGINAGAEEKTKKYSESWPANGVKTLEINNRFGEIRIVDNGGDNVTIDVLVTVEASGIRKAEELLNYINVSFNKTGNTVSAYTQIEENFNSNRRFSIDYEVNIPPDKNLDITNKYGNTFINALKADGNFNIQYGNITVNDLNTPEPGFAKLNLSYGKSNIENAGNINAIVKYSNLSFGTLSDLELESKYTVINIDKAGSIKAESKYDTFNFGKVNSLQANAKYTQLKIGGLNETLILESGYGGINVDNIASTFKEVRITSSYGKISLGMNSMNYSVDANCYYCGITFPDNRFSGDKIRENQTHVIKGRVGNSPGGEVFIKSRYGGIVLE